MEVKLLVFQLSLIVLLVFGKPTLLDDDRGEWICKSKPPEDENGGCGCGCGCGCNGTCGCGNLTFDIANFLDMYTPSTKPKKDVIFYLYKSPSESIELNQDNVENLDKNLETKIIIHGWFEDANATWALKMKDEYLKAGEYNVIIIDYGYYGKTGYYKAVKNRHKVGEKIAKLLIAAEKHAGLDFNKVHLIGHSLGAHVCAEVAEHLQKASVLYKLNRISGLDPAGPLFHNSTMRESAKFVDIYHTGAIFFGIKKEIGTADYYINGGLMQPDCKTQSIGNKSLRYGLNVFYEILNFANNKCAAKVWDILCNHVTSTWYWVSSISSNKSHDSDRVFGKPTLLDDDRGEWICKSKPLKDDNGGCGCGCGCGCNGTCGCANLTFDIANFLDMYTPSTKPKKDVIFYLYKSPTESIELNQDNVENLDKNLETKIIIHGWFEDANATWALKMKDEYLKAGEYNVIIIDYGCYAKTGYYKAVKNRHRVGEKTAKLLIAAERHAGLDFNKVHLIGHSLGAHVCAEVAEHLQKASVLYKLNRISGLDPAGPLFHDSTMRESAKFVDIYHTGAIFFGIKKEIGTADYYINGGLMQPDCKTQSIGNKSLRYGLNVFYETLNFANNKCAAKVWDISCNHGTSTWYWYFYA